MMKRHGFTLIELLVVITIMTTLLSLVAPLTVEQVDKSRAAAEFMEARQYLNDSGKVAFLRGQTATFIFDGKRLTRYLGEESVVLDFNYLYFPQQQLTINANGFAQQQYITVLTGNRTQQITLSEPQ